MIAVCPLLFVSFVKLSILLRGDRRIVFGFWKAEPVCWTFLQEGVSNIQLTSTVGERML